MLSTQPALLRRRDKAAGHQAHYHADYYAAYVLTPDGVNLEAVCQVAS